MLDAKNVEIEDFMAATKDGRTAVQLQRVNRTQKRRIEDLERENRCLRLEVDSVYPPHPSN